jgi:replicative DNA helicase
LEKLKDIIGRNRKGGFNAGAKNLAQFTEREVRALTEALQRQMNRKGFKDLTAAESKKQAVAYQLGLGSPAELDKYADVLPSLWHVLELARATQAKGYDRSLYNAVSEAMQAGFEPEELKSVLDQMAAEHEGYIEEKTEAEEAGTEIPTLDYTELSQKYADMLQTQEDIDEFDDLTGDEWITIDS